MEPTIIAAAVLSGVAFGSGNWFLGAAAFALALIALVIAGWYVYEHAPFRRAAENPILGPDLNNPWESQAVFNPAAYYDGETVHLLYRALGNDGISRLGYASSKDGVHFHRLKEPVYIPHVPTPEKYRNPFTSPARLTYDRALYASGGGWGGSEDPRMVAIGGRVHVTFNIFNGWDSMRVGLLSLDESELKERRFDWDFNFLSAPGRNKNWVLFPEKIRGKYAVLHNLYADDPDSVRVAYVDEIEVPTHLPPMPSPDPHHMPNHVIGWHNRMRSAGAPPLKTDRGWLLFYHAMDKDDPDRYKVGALLLDPEDPTRIVHRAVRPVLEPDMPYENDWKPGIVYASGAIIKDGELFLYYGGGDKTVNVATADLGHFLDDLIAGRSAKLAKARV